MTIKQVREALAGTVDTVGKKKDGSLVVRRGYYYRNGMDAEKFASVVQQLVGSGFRVTEHGDHWAPFRGGATVAQGSHFYAVLVKV